MNTKEKILEIKNLYVSFNTYAGEVKVLRGISFYANRGETLAIVGESGSGKSVTVQTTMKLIPSPPAVIKSGEILLNGEDIVKKTESEMQKIRGGKIGMIFQNPMGSLNPTMKIGKQIIETIKLHNADMNKKQIYNRAVEMLNLVGINNPKQRMKSYAHQFSGGMRQRIVIAIALSCNPDLLIADEPTTALDVTIQAQILDLMNDLQKKLNTSIILITHDLGVVKAIAKRVIVMYGGEIMEEMLVSEINQKSEHPYTIGLLKSMPSAHVGKDKDALFNIEGTPPDLINPPKGCPFAPRCEYCMRICKEEKPLKTKISNSHFVVCWLQDKEAPKLNFISNKRG